MNETQRAAAERLAKELASVHPLHPYAQMCGSAADLLRELLAEPVQEQVAWFCGELGNLREVEHWANGAFPVYTHPPQQRRPLTEAQINKLPEARGWWPCSLNDRIFRLIRAVEHAHGITGETT